MKCVIIFGTKLHAHKNTCTHTQSVEKQNHKSCDRIAYSDCCESFFSDEMSDNNTVHGIVSQLKKVAKLGPKAYEQCAGFLRIKDGKNILDNTSVHPESYGAAEMLLEKLGYTMEDVKSGGLGAIAKTAKQTGIEKLAEELEIGTPTLLDILGELQKPGRDIRAEVEQPILRSDVMSMEDLKEGMVLTGTVRNVIDFGAFVDIGVHQDGLVHISQLSDQYVKHPMDVVSIGDIVKVKVLSCDVEKKRISLTMKNVE